MAPLTLLQLAVKLVSIFNHNPARGLPLIYGLVTLFEAATGRPLALLEGGTLTAVRTGAVGLALQALDGTKIQAAASTPQGWSKEYMEEMGRK